jgi:hypothetical protein
MTETNTTLKEQVEQLVYAYDLNTLNVESVLPDDVKRLAVTEDLLRDNLPTLEARADLVAYSACFYAYLNQTPNGTREQFNETLNPEALESVSQNIRTKLAQDVNLADVVKFHRDNCSIPTRVDLKRQVKS